MQYEFDLLNKVQNDKVIAMQQKMPCKTYTGISKKLISIISPFDPTCSPCKTSAKCSKNKIISFL